MKSIPKSVKTYPFDQVFFNDKAIVRVEKSLSLEGVMNTV